MQLRRSKTDRFGHSVTLVIGPTGTSTCPVAAMRAFLCKRNHSRNGPLFVLQCGRFLTRRRVSFMLRVLLHSAGVDPTGYSSHSFRIGAATTAAAAGLPDHLGQNLGSLEKQRLPDLYSHLPGSSPWVSS